MKPITTKTVTTSVIALIAMSATAHAGGFERSGQSVTILFKQGRQLELGFRAGFPEVDGVAVALTPGVESGNIAENFVDFSAAFKFDINQSFSAAIIYDEPFATDIAYPMSNYFLSGSTADLKIREVMGVVQYNLPPSMAVFGGGLSVYGGPRLSYTTATAAIPSNGYNIDVDNKFGFGYLAGVAWERPKLGMRASLTYMSEIKNDLDTQESFGGGPVVHGKTALDTPQSLTFEFQAALNPKTLLFGSVRWVEWGDFTVEPPLFTGVTGGPLAFFLEDTITYRLGLGHRLSKEFSIFGDVSYEPQTDEVTGNLTPRDGFVSFGAGGTYTFDKVSLTLAGRYALLGDADTVPAPGGPNVAQFRDNQAFFIGSRLGFDLN